MAVCRRDVVVQNLVGQTSKLDGSFCPSDLGVGAYEDPDFMGLNAIRRAFSEPMSDDVAFLVVITHDPNTGWRAVENRYRVASIFCVAIDVGHRRVQQAVRLTANLVRRPVIDAKCA